jgi:FkbM family methyltransferase
MKPLLPPDFGIETWGNIASRLTSLRNLGFTPRSILDIGAYHGHFSTVARWIWSDAEILMIEANESCRSQLDGKGFPFEIAVLDSTAGERDFHQCQTGCGEGNGLYRENSIFPFATIKRQTQRLDDVLRGRSFDFIKLDCQGAERRIIEGGEETVRGAQVIQIETQVQDYNEGAPRIADMIPALGYYGFRLFDITDMHYNSRGMLIQTDLMFVRQDSPLFKIRPLS